MQHALEFDATELQRVQVDSFNLSNNEWKIRAILKGDGNLTIIAPDDSSFRGYIRVSDVGLLTCAEASSTTQRTFDTGESFADSGGFRELIIHRTGFVTSVYVDQVYKGTFNQLANLNWANVSTKMNMGALYRTGAGSDFYYSPKIELLEIESNSTVIHKWDANTTSRTGTTWTDEVGTNDGTLINFAGDDSGWIATGSYLESRGFTLLGSIEAPFLSGAATDVPLLVKPSTEFTAAMLAGLQTDGSDLRFGSEDGETQYAREIVDGLNVVWVKAAGLSITAGTTIHVWGDNVGAIQPATTDTYGSEAVWSDYEAVIHANEVGTNGVFADSTGNGYDTTLTTGTLGTTTTDNPFGLAWPDFDTSQVVKLTSSYAMLNNTAYSVSMWWNADVSENFIGLFGSRYKSPSDSNNIQITSDGRPSNNPSGFINVSQSANVTRLLKIKCDSASLQLMTNGVQLGIDTTVSIATNNTQVTQDFRIGTYYDDGAIRRYNGNVGEIRVKKFKDVDAFDLIEYDNQSEPNAWWIASDVAGGTTGTITQNTAAFTQSLAGNTVAPPTTGTINQSTTAFTQSALGSVTQLGITGVITQAISAFTQSLVGDVVSSGVNGSITQTTGSFTQALLGNTVLNVTGTVTQSSSAFTQSLIGTTAEQISGIITQSVSSFTQSLVGEVPAQWIDKPRAVTIWGDNTPVFTLWTDK